MATGPTPALEGPSQQDFGEISKLIGGYRVSQAIYAVVELGIPDLLRDGPKHCEELAAETDAHAPTLYRVLRFLAGAGLFNEVAPRLFDLTQLGSTLRADVPGSAGTATRLLLSEFLWSPWSHLIHSVRTGEPAFQHAHGMGVFDYLRQHPEASAIFNAAMTNNSARSGAGVVEHYDFSRFRTIVDVGGGHGFLLATILRAHPTLRGVLFDLPEVVEGAGKILEDAGVRDRCDIVGGSFFDSVPRGGDAYVLRQIVHDWDDSRASAILRNCRTAMAGAARLLVLEREIAPDDRKAMGVLHIDMEMLVNVAGMERTKGEYRSLFETAAFHLR